MRKDWNTYFMNLAKAASTRSTCDRAFVGAVIVKNKRVISTGYNGSVGSGAAHCDDVGHTIVDGHCVATIHAEQNAIIHAAKLNIPLDNCDIYVTHFPCINCVKLIIMFGIKNIYYHTDYRPDSYAKMLLKSNNVATFQIHLEEG